MTQVNDGLRTSNYVYGADGNRRSKTVGGITTQYIHDGSSLIGEIYSNTAAQRFTADAK